jgi:hypothetical protein
MYGYTFQSQVVGEPIAESGVVGDLVAESRVVGEPIAESRVVGEPIADSRVLGEPIAESPDTLHQTLLVLLWSTMIQAWRSSPCKGYHAMV